MRYRFGAWCVAWSPTLLLGMLLAIGTCIGCGNSSKPDNQVPDNPAPLPDPSQRIEG